MKIFLKIVILSLLILMVGCGTPPKSQSPQQVNQDEKQIQINYELAEKAKIAADTVKGVKESTAVAINKDIYAAIKVNGFDRLRLKPIKEEVQKKIKELNKDYNVHVTSDKKLFMHLQQIEKQVNEKSFTDLPDKVNKLNKDMQERI